MSKQSMRQIAKKLDISPAYLSYMVNGKRPWRKDLYQRYVGVVNAFVNSDGERVIHLPDVVRQLGTKNGVPDRIRTCDPLLRRQPLYPLSYWDTRGQPEAGSRICHRLIDILRTPREGCQGRFTGRGAYPVMSGDLHP